MREHVWASVKLSRLCRAVRVASIPPQAAFDIFPNEPLGRDLRFRSLRPDGVRHAPRQPQVDRRVLDEPFVALQPTRRASRAGRQVVFVDIGRIEGSSTSSVSIFGNCFLICLSHQGASWSC